MSGDILYEVLRRGVQFPRQADCCQRDCQDAPVSGQDFPCPPPIEYPRFRQGCSPLPGRRVRAIEQKRAHQHCTVHPYISAPQQIIQAVISDYRRQPALLPDMVPADQKNHQCPKPVHFRDPFLLHGASVSFRLSFSVSAPVVSASSAFFASSLSICFISRCAE